MGHALGMVAKWSNVLTAVPWPLMVWSTLALSAYQLRFISWVFHVIFSFVHFISLYTLGGLCAFRKPLPYNMYLCNRQMADHIIKDIFIMAVIDGACMFIMAVIDGACMFTMYILPSVSFVHSEMKIHAYIYIYFLKFLFNINIIRFLR